jgi:hypothetical protein
MRATFQTDNSPSESDNTNTVQNENSSPVLENTDVVQAEKSLTAESEDEDATQACKRRNGSGDMSPSKRAKVLCAEVRSHIETS